MILVWSIKFPLMQVKEKKKNYFKQLSTCDISFSGDISFPPPIAFSSPLDFGEQLSFFFRTDSEEITVDDISKLQSFYSCSEGLNYLGGISFSNYHSVHTSQKKHTSSD